MLIPFKKEHLEVMDMRDHERELLAVSDYFGEILELATVSQTFIINGRVIACAGASINVFGAGEIWLIPSIYLKEHGLIYLRLAKDWLNNFKKNYDLKRMQTVAIDDDLHNSHMKFLGFENEGKMKQYALGKDYQMWGRVWD